MADVTVYLIAGAIAALLAFGVIALRNNPHAALNRLMFTLTLTMSAWSFAILMITINSEYEILLFWIRFSYAAAILFPWHIYALSVTFLTGDPLARKATYFLFGASLISFFISFTPFMVAGIGEPLAMKEPVPGPFFGPYFALYFIILAYSIIQLYRKFKKARGVVRFQMQYFIRGTLFFVITSTLANAMLPYYGITQLGLVDIRSLGPAFSLVMAGSIYYAIIRYRFMDIRFAFRKNIAYIFAITIITLLLAGLFRLLISLNLAPMPINLEVGVIMVVLTVALILPGLKTRIQHILDERLFKKVTDYRASLLNRINDLVTLLNLEDLLKSLTASIVNDMDLEHGFYCRKINGRYAYSRGEDEVESLPGDYDWPVYGSENVLLSYLEQTRDILLLSEVKKIKNISLHDAIWQEMKKGRLSAAVPLVAEDEVAGILFLGEKISGEPYYSEDLQLLSILASQVTVTIKNARLYQDLLSVKQYLEEVLANMGNGLVAVNEAGLITLINSEAEKLIGKSGRKVIGKKASSILPENLNELIERTFKEAGGFSDQETALERGSKKHFLSCSTSIIEPSGAGVREVIMVMSNISRTKMLEKEKSMAQRLASLGEFAAGIAHEIKNPLVSIKTFADLLPDKYDHPEFRHRFSTVVSQEITRINDLVVELLGFVRDTDLYYEPVNLTGLVDEVLLLLSPHLEQQNIAIKKKYSSENEVVRLDRTLIKQALLNICLNAVHAMPDQGLLTVGVCYQSDKINITVEDTGVGIPDAIKDKVFDPFVTGKANGIGIGLSICHKIINAHSGQISFASKEGRGTRFDINLPIMTA